MNVTRKSMITGITHTLDLDVTPEQIAAYERGELIQVAFPDLSTPDREFIMTGVTAEEWQTHMAPPPDDMRNCAECGEPSALDCLDINETPLEWQCPFCDAWNEKKQEVSHA
jgi:hypothetical protein